MNPPEMLDHKADLMVRLENPLVYRAFRDQVNADIRWIGDEEKFPKAHDRERRNAANAAAIITTLKMDLPEAECFHVSQDMTQVVQFAATQLEEMDRFSRDILPTRSGIARFEGGIPWVDVRGKSMRLSWVVWGPILGTDTRHDTGEPSEWTHFWMFNDHIIEPDEIALDMMQSFDPESLRQVFGRWGFMGGEYLTEGQRLGPAMRIPDDEKVAEVLADGAVPQAYTNPQRLLQALWLLLGQTVADVSEAPIDRARRKRAGRAGIPDRVTVVQLRNIQSKKTDGESLVEWSHRWVVRGFWRWQTCGPNHPLAQELEPGVYRARIWIAPFVKGPKDKPLVVTEKVYALHR